MELDQRDYIVAIRTRQAAGARDGKLIQPVSCWGGIELEPRDNAVGAQEGQS
jgi:hypothetical protein